MRDIDTPPTEFFCRWDSAEKREELRTLVLNLVIPVTDGDYKDFASDFSDILGEVCPKHLKRLAHKLGLMSGYDCPRTTLKARSALLGAE